MVERPNVTLELPRARVKAEFDRDVSLTLKKLYLIPFGTNNPDEKNRDKHYAFKVFEVDRQEDGVWWD